jgi:excisionase family DNA binding protein
MSHKPDLNDDLLPGAAAAAAYIGVDRRSVYRMTEQGQLPAIRKGRRLFFRKTELDLAFASLAEAA